MVEEEGRERIRKRIEGVGWREKEEKKEGRGREGEEGEGGE